MSEKTSIAARIPLEKNKKEAEIISEERYKIAMKMTIQGKMENT